MNVIGNLAARARLVVEPGGSWTRIDAAIERARRSVATDVLDAPVSAVMPAIVVCVRSHTPVGVLRRVSTQPRGELLATAEALPVVDEGLLYVGAIPRDAWESASLEHVAHEVASDDTPCIDHDRPLRDAFVAMVRQHSRRLVVVGSRRELYGVLTDIDALRWVSMHARSLARASDALIA